MCEDSQLIFQFTVIIVFRIWEEIRWDTYAEFFEIIKASLKIWRSGCHRRKESEGSKIRTAHKHEHDCVSGDQSFSTKEAFSCFFFPLYVS